ncbi:MAG: RNA-binding protein [Candidatus Gracilibacteria bacterium]|nr:RNA-binding protein [Candidatus Gracilibacteria bacterium]
MAKKLYVGNLAWSTTADSLRGAFEAFGEVEDAVIISDKMSGRSKGFGFVTMADDAAADKAIAEMDGKDLDGRQIKVSEARPMKDRD